MLAHSPISSVLGISTIVLCLVLPSPHGWSASFTSETSEDPLQQESSLSDLVPRDTVITLTLKEAVLHALENNLDISVSRHTRNIRVTDIVFQQAQFDPTVQL
nr:hypothetical protein [Nitrospirales bacterium]